MQNEHPTNGDYKLINKIVLWIAVLVKGAAFHNFVQQFRLSEKEAIHCDVNEQLN